MSTNGVEKLSEELETDHRLTNLEIQVETLKDNGRELIYQMNKRFDGIEKTLKLMCKSLDLLVTLRSKRNK